MDSRWCFVVATALATAACGGSSGGAAVPPTDGAAADLTPAADVPVGVDRAGGADVPAEVGAADASVDAPADAPAPDATPTPDVATCGPGESACGGRCVRTGDDAMNCGRCANACPAVPNGAAACQGGLCGFTCGAGFIGSPRGCVAPAAPRPVAPLSLGDVSRARPTLAWTLPPSVDGAEVDLCRDRACTSVIERLTVTGTTATPTMPLPARSAVYWRLRGRAGSLVATSYSPTWMFHVPARDGLADTSAHAHLDVNGDGYDDLVAAAPGATVDGRAGCGVVRVHLGSATGPSATPSLLIAGAAAGDAFGWTVENAGDVNGDGFGDVLVGAALADGPAGADAGAVSVYLGGAAGLSTTLVSVIPGVLAGENRGGSLAAAGDINRDGYGDILIGSTMRTTEVASGLGSVVVYLGSPSGVDTGLMQTIAGATPNDAFGASLASAGDVNGDGYGDVIIGSPKADPGGRTDAGTATIWLGAEMGLMTRASVLEGAAADERLGMRVAYAGDINADGLSDVAVASIFARPGGRLNAGKVQVFAGSATGATGALVTLEGARNFDRLGQEIVGGDFNGDGLGDLAVASRNIAIAGIGTEVGVVYVHLGNGASLSVLPARVLTGTADFEEFGGSIGANDYNGDGLADLLIGAYGASPGGRAGSGRVSLYYGASSGIGATTSSAFEGLAPVDYFGQHVAWAPRGASFGAFAHWACTASDAWGRRAIRQRG